MQYLIHVCAVLTFCWFWLVMYTTKRNKLDNECIDNLCICKCFFLFVCRPVSPSPDIPGLPGASSGGWGTVTSWGYVPFHFLFSCVRSFHACFILKSTHPCFLFKVAFPFLPSLCVSLLLLDCYTLHLWSLLCHLIVITHCVCISLFFACFPSSSTVSSISAFLTVCPSVFWSQYVFRWLISCLKILYFFLCSEPAFWLKL